jgi:hypothetical protein
LKCCSFYQIARRFDHHQYQLFPSLPRDAFGETAVEGRRHPNAALDLHQVLPGINPLKSPLQQSMHVLVASQALPYVALLIVMLFFIYAVIGMQVSNPINQSINQSILL